ncbi:MAG: hypothetical protein EWV81_07005 [Microcystis aeruginosa Ma_SC_T_19800800_S464]|uniref:Uncharacterized protein n=1 Tax=Microcystis aeruginosa Ma_SC_T_19800800_S464 TaxID=2486257 RepID=A0A552DZL2_MICAE|nr:MAG: hypothetical protein EWV81_07005 [Microcystis aeruginosa Ma_SC_T_19800800_S464]
MVLCISSLKKQVSPFVKGFQEISSLPSHCFILFLPNQIFEPIFFSLIFPQKPYIYGRTDYHYT